MMDPDSDVPQPRISLLNYLQQHGWKVVRDLGGDEVAGLCPLHAKADRSRCRIVCTWTAYLV